MPPCAAWAAIEAASSSMPAGSSSPRGFSGLGRSFAAGQCVASSGIIWQSSAIGSQVMSALEDEMGCCASHLASVAQNLARSSPISAGTGSGRLAASRAENPRRSWCAHEALALSRRAPWNSARCTTCGLPRAGDSSRAAERSPANQVFHSADRGDRPASVDCARSAHAAA